MSSFYTKQVTGGGGTASYDAVVAASGGDYETIGAAIAGGATSIFVQPGTYNEDAETITGDVRIVGASRDDAVVNIAGNNWTLQNTVALRDLKFTSSGGTISFNGLYSVIGCRFISTGTTTMIDINEGGEFIGNQVTGDSIAANDYLVDIDFGTAGAKISNNRFYLTSNNSGSGVILLNGGSRYVFTDNWIRTTGSNVDAIVATSVVDHGVIADNLIYGNAGAGSDVSRGLAFTSGSQSSDRVITGNYISDFDTGIYFASQDILITITGNQIAGPNKGIIANGGADRWTITGNSLYGADRAGAVGITIAGTAPDGTISGNNIANYPTGISLGSSVSNYTVTGNIINDATTAAISDSGSGNIVNSNLPTSVNDAAGGAWNLASYSTATGATEITVSGLNMNTNNGHYRVIFEARMVSGASADSLDLQINGITTLDTYQSVWSGYYLNGATEASASSSDAAFQSYIRLSSRNMYSWGGTIDFYIAPNSSGTAQIACKYNLTATGDTTDADSVYTVDGAGRQNNQTNVTAIKLSTGSNRDWKVWVLYPSTS